MAAIVRQYNARGESNTFVGASNPGQLPSNYMYPTSIDDDIAVNSQTSTQVPQNGQIQSMSTQQDSSTQPSAPVVSRPGTSIHNGYRGMASNPSQPAPRQPPSTQRRMSQHVRAGRSRNNPQLSRRARTARTSVQNHADYDRGESTDEQD